MWTRNDAWLTAALLEQFAIQCDMHIALGGSVLHKGSSTKDLDIFCYAHKPPLNPQQVSNFLLLLGNVGIYAKAEPTCIPPADLIAIGETRIYWRSVIQLETADRKRIDLFCMQG